MKLCVIYSRSIQSIIGAVDRRAVLETSDVPCRMALSSIASLASILRFSLMCPFGTDPCQEYGTESPVCSTAARDRHAPVRAGFPTAARAGLVPQAAPAWKALYDTPDAKHFASMKDPSSPTFIARVRASMTDLHPTERRLAETLLNFPGDMAGYTATEVAKVAGVSNATVSRFVRKIGYGNYEEARRAVRDAGKNGAALLRLGAADMDAKRAFEVHLEQSRRTLDKTYEELDITVIDEMVGALHAAPRVWLAGYRAGYPLATYLAWQIGQVLPSVRVIPKPGETLAETVATFSERDVLILLGLRRSTRAAQALLEMALDAGVQVAVIGDVAELLAAEARWNLACTTASTGPLLNHTGVIALCNLVATRTLELAGPEGRVRMERIEDIHEQLGEL